jgi:hypothetical protein
VILERSPQHYLAKALSVGPFTQALIERILTYSSYPEQGYKTCDGILNLGARYGAKVLELSAKYAKDLDVVNYHVLHQTITQELYLREPEQARPVVHRHVRGGDYYAQLNKNSNAPKTNEQ